MRWTMFLAVGVTVAGCASGRSHVDVSPAEVAFEAPPASGGETARSPEPDVTPAVLTRALLQRTIQAGIGAFLAGVELSPVVERGRFVGFRVDGARGLSRWNAGGVDLRAGDVVTRINDAPIERPEQAQAAFWALRDASEVVVDVLRAGAPVTVRVAVLADPASASVSSVTAPATAAR